MNIYYYNIVIIEYILLYLMKLTGIEPIFVPYQNTILINLIIFSIIITYVYIILILIYYIILIFILSL